ncbi:MAG: D-alanyl-D-alanine carboxypeptidase, partial [Actinomycetota bacterium]|nr:D-alanyl-D-alanine carboxypeptidase [Actinomycetota bacterium]
MRRPTAVTATAVALALVASAPASATLGARLTRALTVPGVSWSRTGAVVVDLASGRRLYGGNPGRSLKPASNEKLTVALAALDELGSTFRIPTDVLGEGRLDGHLWRGALVLKGYGDPALSRRDLLRLAEAIRRRGIHRLTRPVEGDESYFDRRRTAPGWKPSFYKTECPPLSALVVDRARVAGRTVDDPALSAARAFSRALRSAGVR